MSCGTAGKKKSVYTGNQVGAFGFVGLSNFVGGGPPGSGLSAGTTVMDFIASAENRRVWLRQDATFDDKLLDAAYPTIDLQWFVEIEFDADTTFRFSDRAFYVQDEAGLNRFYDARAERPPTINATLGEWLQNNYEVGDTQITLNNRDGFLNPYLPMGAKYRQWTGVKVSIYVGFGEKRENYMRLFEGQITDKQGLTATRDTVELRCFDKFDLDEVPLPPRTFSSDNFPEIDSTFANKQVPLVYGDWTEEVPSYGAVNAICINALEEDPDTYKFKISDTALEEIQAVFLHRGDRSADKPQGPIRLADNVLTRDEDSGEFEIPANGVILDEPYYIANRIKAGQGSDGPLITADNGFNFIEQGVKPGDTVVNGAPTQATLTVGNLSFKSTAIGAAGNKLGIEYYLLPAVEVDNGTRSKHKCYATLTTHMSGKPLIRVGITQYTDKDGHIQIGKRTAGAIKAAIADNLAANALVRCAFVGSVPFGYPENTRVSEVNQAVPMSVQVTAGGQNAGLSAEVLTVANYQITVDGDFSFSPGTEYSISTVQYKFMKSDKFTVLCRGKRLNLLSVDRLSDVSTSIRKPNGIAVAFDQTYWICDDETRAVYNLSFDQEILRTLPYSDIDPSITTLSSVAVGSDNTLWVTAPDHSTIYRYDLAEDELGLSFATSTVTGLPTLANITGISARPDLKIWIVDQGLHRAYLINAFSGVNPFVEATIDTRTADPAAVEPSDIAYDDQTGQLLFVDRATQTIYRVNQTTGALISSIPLSDVSANITYAAGACVAQDGTVMLVDQGTLSVYNYNDMADASNNPAMIARDLLQKFGGHTYEEFDLTWMQTARQLSRFRCRAVFDKKSQLVKEVNRILNQYNTAFFLRFGKYSLFYIHFDNFTTDGKVVGEKDIKADSFKPGKEMNQYFNSANANFDYRPFAGDTRTADTYVSTAAISFAGKEYLKTLSMENVYRRGDLDKLIPLHVRLAAPEPEFIDVTFGFRVLRSQMQDFMTLTFDDSAVMTGRSSGRRYAGIPCMIRKLQYDLGPMTVSMKLWSLGGTAFGSYQPPGSTVGGQNDQILLSSLGRMGRIAPTATITAAGVNSLTLANVGSQDAQARTTAGTNLAWTPGYRVALANGLTKEVEQVLTIASVAGDVVTFVEDLTGAVVPTVKNLAGFVTGGHILQYADYNDQTQAQRAIYACFGRPGDNYPASRTQELEEQRGGLHSFDDGGLPYILYPIGFNPSL